jgi:hypothetical protein
MWCDVSTMMTVFVRLLHSYFAFLLITLIHDLIKQNLLVREDIDVNEHERLFNLTLKVRHKLM